MAAAGAGAAPVGRSGCVDMMRKPPPPLPGGEVWVVCETACALGVDGVGAGASLAGDLRPLAGLRGRLVTEALVVSAAGVAGAEGVAPPMLARYNFTRSALRALLGKETPVALSDSLSLTTVRVSGSAVAADMAAGGKMVD